MLCDQHPDTVDTKNLLARRVAMQGKTIG